jgi:peptidyl-prolyl isomerase E (cyclophilin E)
MSSKTVFIGGLADEVTEALLRATLIPFGDIKEVSLPIDSTSQSHRGFGFATFEDEIDAAAAIANLDGAELLGRTLRVNASQPRTSTNKSVFDEAQEWFANSIATRTTD